MLNRTCFLFQVCIVKCQMYLLRKCSSANLGKKVFAKNMYQIITQLKSGLSVLTIPRRYKKLCNTIVLYNVPYLRGYLERDFNFLFKLCHLNFPSLIIINCNTVIVPNNLN